MRKVVFLGLIALLLVPAAQAQRFAYTSFEEPAVFTVQYVDLGDPLVDHALADNAGEPFVNYPASGPEIGFNSWYYNSRGGVGLTDGDFVGVTDFAGTVGAYVDGTKGFQISDADGAMRVIFDAVDCTGRTDPHVHVHAFVQTTGYEADDVLRIWVVVDDGVGTTEVDLFNSTGLDINDMGVEGMWIEYIEDLTAYSPVSAQVMAELDCNSGTEAVFLDLVEFTEGVPVTLQSFDVE